MKHLLLFPLLVLSLQVGAGEIASPNEGEDSTSAGLKPTALAKKSLADVYALSEAEVEKKMMERLGETCAGLISATPGKDPNGLTPAQKCAVQYYSGSGYEVNVPLWKAEADGKTLNGDQWAYVRVLDAALKKLKPESKEILYRGATSKEFPYTKAGDIVRLKGYSSTSTSKDVAEGFIKDRFMIIKKSKSGRSIKRYSNAGLEDELLLPRSTRVVLESSVMKDMEIFTEESGPQMRRVEVITVHEAP